MKDQKTNEKVRGKAIIMIMSIPERINFTTILIPNGSMIEMEMATALAERIQLTRKEEEEYEYVLFPDGRYSYNMQKARSREFSFEPYEILLIQQGIKMLDSMKQIYPYNLALAKRFLSINIDTKCKN